jgi:stalled ribosome rescue protein Dom34
LGGGEGEKVKLFKEEEDKFYSTKKICRKGKSLLRKFTRSRTRKKKNKKKKKERKAERSSERKYE